MEMGRGVFLALSSIFVGISVFFLRCFIFLPFSLCLTCFFHFVHLFQINRISHCWVSLDPKKKLKFSLESFWVGKSSAEDSVIHLKTHV